MNRNQIKAKIINDHNKKTPDILTQYECPITRTSRVCAHWIEPLESREYKIKDQELLEV